MTHQLLLPSVAELVATFSGHAVFVGGTNGIGRAMALALAQNTRKPCRITLVGRNRQRADEAIERMRQTSQVEHAYRFESCDVTTFAAIRRTTAAIKEASDRVNFLVLTCGGIPLKYTKHNNEIEKTSPEMMVQTYSRFLFIEEMLPLLASAKAAREEARTFTVLNCVRGTGKLDFDDLEVTKKFSLRKAWTHVVTLNNVMMEHYATALPAASFSHVFPGHVAGGIPDTFPFGLRQLGKFFDWVKAKPADVYGREALKLLIDPRYTSGYWRLDEKCEPTTADVGETGEEATRKVSKHVREVTRRGYEVEERYPD